MVNRLKKIFRLTSRTGSVSSQSHTLQALASTGLVSEMSWTCEQSMEGKITNFGLYKCINENNDKFPGLVTLWVFNCFRFAAALKDQKVWVMNVVNVDAPDTLPIIFERGLFGMYHDWCESFSTYPRTYDLLHADHLFSRIRDRYNRCPFIVNFCI